MFTFYVCIYNHTLSVKIRIFYASPCSFHNGWFLLCAFMIIRDLYKPNKNLNTMILSTCTNNEGNVLAFIDSALTYRHIFSLYKYCCIYWVVVIGVTQFTTLWPNFLFLIILRILQNAIAYGYSSFLWSFVIHN